MNNWKWFGHAGHLIVGDKCRFHMTTKVGKYLISTVGEYWPERGSREIHAKVYAPKWLADNIHRKGDEFDFHYMKRFGFDTIGYNRKYETMVFLAGELCSSKTCGCGIPEISGSELDFEGYNNAGEARKGHLKLCKKWSRKQKSPTGSHST